MWARGQAEEGETLGKGEGGGGCVWRDLSTLIYSTSPKHIGQDIEGVAEGGGDLYLHFM